MTETSAPTDAGYEFSKDWFSSNLRVWSAIVANEKPSRILEVGSFEGRSTCWLIEKCAAERPMEIHCVDSWEGGIEHQPGGLAATSMPVVESRFERNIAIARANAAHPVEIVKHKMYSNLALADLTAQRKLGYFDLIYIDGSHQAPDVLSDAVMAFPLLRTNGIMIFDDYIWYMEQRGHQDAFNMPKPAIDAFVNINQRKLVILRDTPVNQLYIRKIA